MSRVRPARKRRVLATFSGMPWGTGAYCHARIQCAWSSWTPHSPECRLHPGGPPLVVYWNTHGPYGDYMGILNDTLFCPQPAGLTGEIPLPFWLRTPQTELAHLRVDYTSRRFYVRWVCTSIYRTCHTLRLLWHAGLEQIIRPDWTTWNIPLGRTSSFSIFSRGNWTTSKEHSGHTKCFCIPSWWYGHYYGSEMGSSWTGSAVFCTSIHTDKDYDWMASLKPFLWPDLEACCLIVTDTNTLSMKRICLYLFLTLYLILQI